MKKSRLLSLFAGGVLIACGLFFGVILVRAENACEQTCSTKESCQKKSDECGKLVDEAKGQQKTLLAAIDYLNNKIHLAQNQIFLTQIQIDQLEKDIATLGVRIDGLEVSLKRLTEVLLTRIQDDYKQKPHDTMLLLLTSNGFGDFVSRYKYIRLSQEYTQKLLKEAETQKILYGEEKQNKEKKQAEVEALKKKLQTQQAQLTDQQKQKQSLLQLTQNDEKKYQALKDQADAQIRAFSGFVQSHGGSGLLSGQTSCDGWGCYYNQRDSQWGSHGIGLSGEPMSAYGCLVTSMAMISTHYGKNLTPGDIAGSSAPFFGSTAYMIAGGWTVNGVSMNRTRIGYSSGSVDGELDAGHPVVVGLFSSSNPSHFIVIKGKDSGGYIMNDPYLESGKDKHLTDKYSVGDIRVVDRVSVN